MLIWYLKTNVRNGKCLRMPQSQIWLLHSLCHWLFPWLKTCPGIQKVFCITIPARNEYLTNLGSVAACCSKNRLRLLRTHAKAQIATSGATSVSSVSSVSPRLSRPKAKRSGTCSHWEIPWGTQNRKKQRVELVEICWNTMSILDCTIQNTRGSIGFYRILQASCSCTLNLSRLATSCHILSQSAMAGL